jgi:hypothetical protein
MYWTPERIAEVEAECDRRILRRDNPIPALPTVEQATAVVRHALNAYAMAPDGELACTADRAAARAVQALTGAWLLHLDAGGPGPDRPEPAAGRREPFAAVTAERAKQDSKWGEQNHPDGTGEPHEAVLAEAKRRLCETAAGAGALTWRDILDEEVAEAFAETDPARLRAELVQVAAVAVAWIEAIDRRGQATIP